MFIRGEKNILGAAPADSRPRLAQCSPDPECRTCAFPFAASRLRVRPTAGNVPWLHSTGSTDLGLESPRYINSWSFVSIRGSKHPRTGRKKRGGIPSDHSKCPPQFTGTGRIRTCNQGIMLPTSAFAALFRFVVWTIPSRKIPEFRFVRVCRLASTPSAAKTTVLEITADSAAAWLGIGMPPRNSPADRLGTTQRSPNLTDSTETSRCPSRN